MREIPSGPQTKPKCLCIFPSIKEVVSLLMIYSYFGILKPGFSFFKMDEKMLSHMTGPGGENDLVQYTKFKFCFCC